MGKLIYFSNLKWLLVSLIVIFLDFLTKNWVMCNCSFAQPVAVFSFFNLYYIYNTGISFSLFSDFGIEKNIILLLLIMSIIFILIVMLCFIDKSYKNFFIKISYAIIIGGALGNVIDRIRYGAVIDFIDIHIAHYHWPTFNIADLSIFFGVFFVLYFRE